MTSLWQVLQLYCDLETRAAEREIGGVHVDVVWNGAAFLCLRQSVSERHWCFRVDEHWQVNLYILSSSLPNVSSHGVVSRDTLVYNIITACHGSVSKIFSIQFLSAIYCKSGEFSAEKYLADLKDLKEIASDKCN